MSAENMTKKIEESGLAASSEKPEKKSLEELKKTVEADIDQFIVRMELAENPKDLKDEEGVRHFPAFGSSEGGFARVYENEGQLYFKVAASVMEMPADKELILPLMRELLTINVFFPTFGRLGIMDKRVYATMTYPVELMNREDVGRTIYSVFSLADSVDDRLKKKYGGTTKKRAGKK